MDIIALQYNNYFNRIIKKEDNVTAYRTFPNRVINNVNYNPEDGINTTQVFNLNPFDDGFSPDYAIYVDGQNNIVSRWFIIEAKRTRKGQYILTLKRDVIADKLDSVLDSPCFVEKGEIDYNDVAIYNKEGMAFNQIKKYEEQLKDDTGIAWIVGYMAPNTEDTTVTVSTPTDFPYTSVNSISAWSWYNYRETGGNDYKVISKNEVTIRGNTGNNSNLGFFEITTGKTKYNRVAPMQPTDAIQDTRLKFYNAPAGLFKIQAFAQDFLNFANANQARFDTVIANSQSINVKPNDILAIDKTYIKDLTTGKVYRAEVFVRNSSETTVAIGSASSLEDSTLSIIDDYTNANYPDMTINVQGAMTQMGGYKVTTDNYRVRLVETEMPVDGYTVTIPSTANTLTDAPYKMFAIPYGAVEFMYAAGATAAVSISKENALNLACNIATQLGSSLYDIQLLPYCPFINDTYKNSSGTAFNVWDGDKFILSALTADTDYSIIHEGTSTGTFSSFIYFCKRSDFRTRLSYVVNIPADTINRKLAHECAFYRLCSPNYASSFEFNAVANDGYVDYFEVECTYKPYNPFIHVSPNFHGLYGRDYDDYRGLICSGDFSIPRMTEEWVNFQLNNQNYLNTFNREIESLETQYKYEHRNVIAQAISGTITGTVSGAVAGGVATGSPWGAAAGAVVGGIGSAIGAGLDISASEALHKEHMDLQHDRFNMNLQNIQAKPQTLAKASAFDINNKLFPIIELYSCTEQEQQALKDKLTYEGYTINRIGTLREFIRADDFHYVRGTMIRLENLEEDYHFANEIKQEVSEGLYMKG